MKRKINFFKKKTPIIIAEMSGNHNGSLKKALDIVREASKAGADAIKLQTYTAETITINSKSRDFIIHDKKSLWKKERLYNLYKKAHTPWSWHKKIYNLAKKLNLVCFSSPFDETAVDFLEKLNTPFYKIASFEITHLPLIKKVALTKKPMIISTGLASKKEIKEAIKIAKKNGCPQIILLKCTSAYPADITDTNILTIKDLKKSFKCEVGFSDHTLGIGAPLAAISHGAKIIEKHFTISKSDKGVDSAFSMDAKELSLLVTEAKRAYLSLGKVNYKLSSSEKKSKIFRRSIYAKRNIKKGEIFTSHNIKVVRPSYGLSPKYYFKLLGKRSKRQIKKATRILYNDL
jgi:pseudaminic acid synthase